MVFCPNCGTQSPDGATFCGNCGTSLVAQPAAPVANTDTAAEPAAEAAATAAPEPVAAPAAAPVATPAATAAAAPAATSVAAPAAAPAAAKTGSSKMPIIIGAVVVAIVAILLIVFLVVPNCSGAAGVKGGVNMQALTSEKTADAQASLKSLQAYDLDLGSQDVTLYVSSDKMKNFLEDTYENAKNGDITSVDDVINKEKAKELNGEWVLLSTADESLEDAVAEANESVETYDMGHMALFATVVADDDLTNEEIAKLVDGIGLKSEHAVVADTKIADVIDFYGGMMSAASALPGTSASSAKYAQRTVSAVQDALDEAGVTRVGFGSYYGKDVIGLSASVQFDGYAVVFVFADNPNSIEGLDKIYNEEFLKRIYVK